MSASELVAKIVVHYSSQVRRIDGKIGSVGKESATNMNTVHDFVQSESKMFHISSESFFWRCFSKCGAQGLARSP